MRKTQTHPPKRERPKMVKLADKLLTFFGPEAEITIQVAYPGDDNTFHLIRQNKAK